MITKQFWIDILVILSIVSILGVRLTTTIPGVSPAAVCGVAQEQVDDQFVNQRGQTPANDVLVVRLWAPAFYPDCQRLFGPVAAAELVTTPRIQVSPKPFNTDISVYWEALQSAVNQHQTPEIAWLDHTQWLAYASNHSLQSFDRCRQQHPEFSKIPAAFWAQVTWQNKIWGVPSELYLSQLYFSRNKLKALGWSESELNTLPTRIKQGKFTLDDLLNTARRAVELGVVARGYGFWPDFDRSRTFALTYHAYGGEFYRPEQQRFIIDRVALIKSYEFAAQLLRDGLMPGEFAVNDKLVDWPNADIYQDAIAHQTVLFAQLSNIQWVDMGDAVQHLGGRAYLEQNLGVSVYPSAQRGTPGTVMANQVGLYAIFTEQATSSTQQDAACALLAKTMTPAIQAAHRASSAVFSTLQTFPLAPTNPDHAVIPNLLSVQMSGSLPTSEQNRWTAQNIWFPPLQYKEYAQMMAILMAHLLLIERNELSFSANRDPLFSATVADQAISQLRGKLPAIEILE